MMNEPPPNVVRRAIYSIVSDTGAVPDAGALASATGLSIDDVRDALVALAESHVIVLEHDRRAIRFAAPFAAGDTGFRVTAAGRTYSAPCAWDSFGIAAALHADADIDALCAGSGVPIRCGVRASRAYGNAIVHLLVPAAHFWDDIVYT